MHWPTEIFKDRRVLIAAAVVALLIIAAVLFFMFANKNSSDTASVPSNVMPGYPGAPGGIPGGPGGYPGAPGGYPGAPAMASGYPGMPGPGGAPGMVGRPASSGMPAGKSSAVNVPTSWDGAPALIAGGGGVSATSAPGMSSSPGMGGGYPGMSGPPGMSSSPMGGGYPGMSGPPGMGGGGATSLASAAAKPLWVKQGMKAAAYRSDPFESITKLVTLLPPAYSFAVPMRLAMYSKPNIDTRAAKPEEILGPLPYVPRRVAGVLHGSSVSAILETGAPGSDSDVRVVQPGQTQIPSGIPGVGDMTVESINATGLVLRAPDKRRVTVKLTGMPPGMAQSLSPQQPGMGGFPGRMGGGGGYPGAGGGGYPGGR